MLLCLYVCLMDVMWLPQIIYSKGALERGYWGYVEQRFGSDTTLAILNWGCTRLILLSHLCVTSVKCQSTHCLMPSGSAPYWLDTGTSGQLENSRLFRTHCCLPVWARWEPHLATLSRLRHKLALTLYMCNSRFLGDGYLLLTIFVHVYFNLHWQSMMSVLYVEDYRWKLAFSLNLV